MKKLILSAVLFMVLSTMAFAQQDSMRMKHNRHPRVEQTPEKRAQKMTDVLSNKLSLSADQKSKIYAINLASAKKAEIKRKARMAEMKKEKEAIRTELKKHDQQISAVLNDDQIKVYQDLKKERIDHFKKHRRPSHHGKWQQEKTEQEG